VWIGGRAAGRKLAQGSWATVTTSDTSGNDEVGAGCGFGMERIVCNKLSMSPTVNVNGPAFRGRGPDIEGADGPNGVTDMVWEAGLKAGLDAGTTVDDELIEDWNSTRMAGGANADSAESAESSGCSGRAGVGGRIIGAARGGCTAFIAPDKNRAQTSRTQNHQ
jgi:hypothetical protein